MINTKFSVVIPLYNKEPHIERALRSVLAQTVQGFEIIVVDDGSTDCGSEVVKSFKDSRIKLIQQENKGVSAARNRGIKEAKGDLIAFLDADDEWKSEFLEIILRLRRKYPEAGLYVTSYDILSPDGKMQKPNFRGVPPAPWEGLFPKYFIAATLGAQPFNSSSASVPKHIFSELNGFAVGNNMGEDLDMWCRIALKYPIAFSTNIGAIYCQNAVNRSCKKYLEMEEIPVINTLRDAVRKREVPVEMLRDVKEYIANRQIELAKGNILSGNLKFARNILSECKTSKYIVRKFWWIFWTRMPKSFTRFSGLAGIIKQITNTFLFKINIVE